jgi:hypothetical protein
MVCMPANGGFFYPAQSKRWRKSSKGRMVMADRKHVPVHIGREYNAEVYLRMRDKRGINPYRDDNGNYASAYDEPSDGD